MLPQNVTHLQTLPFTVHSPLHIPHSTVPIPHLAHTPDTRAGAPRSPTRRCALHTSHFTVHTADSTPYTPHSRPSTPHSMLHTLCRTFDLTIPISRSALPSTVHVPPSALHTLHSMLFLCIPWAAKYGAHSTLYVALLKLDALHPSLPTLYFFTLPTPHFLHYILHLVTLCALHYSADSAMLLQIAFGFMDSIRFFFSPPKGLGISELFILCSQGVYVDRETRT